MKAFYKVRECQNRQISFHVAWGGFKPLVGKTEHGETQNPIFVGFGPTELMAIGDLQSGMERQGVTSWTKQNL